MSSVACESKTPSRAFRTSHPYIADASIKCSSSQRGAKQELTTAAMLRHARLVSGFLLQVGMYVRTPQPTRRPYILTASYTPQNIEQIRELKWNDVS